MFTIKGKIQGYPQTITYEWKNGHGILSGDPVLLTLVKSASMLPEPAGEPGHWVERNLDEPYSAWWLIRSCLDEVEEENGDIPDYKSLFKEPDDPELIY